MFLCTGIYTYIHHCKNYPLYGYSRSSVYLTGEYYTTKDIVPFPCHTCELQHSTISACGHQSFNCCSTPNSRLQKHPCDSQLWTNAKSTHGVQHIGAGSTSNLGGTVVARLRRSLSGRREGVRESVPYLKSSFIRNLVRLQDVYFLPPVTCCLLFLGCRPSVLWLAIICTTWSRKRAHVVCGRGSKMHRAPSSRFGGHVPPVPPLPSTTGRLGSLLTPRLNTMQSERYCSFSLSCELLMACVCIPFSAL